MFFEKKVEKTVWIYLCYIEFKVILLTMLGAIFFYWHGINFKYLINKNNMIFVKSQQLVLPL